MPIIVRVQIRPDGPGILTKHDDFWLIPFWWKRFLKDPVFVEKLVLRWNTLREGDYATATILQYIDSLALSLESPQRRNFQRWNILGNYIWPNNFVGGTYESEISYLKNWIEDRMAWLDTNIQGLMVITDVEHLSENEIIVYPNPVINQLRIENIESVHRIRLTDISGKLLNSYFNPKKAAFIEINMGELKSGVYLVTLEYNNRLLKTIKVIK